MNFNEIKQLAYGRWLDIISGLGIDIRFNKHTPCPGCGGVDRFRFDDRTGNGDFICNQMDKLSGDGFNLISHVFGVPLHKAFVEVARYLGLDDGSSQSRLPKLTQHQAIKDKDYEKKIKMFEYAQKLWREAGDGAHEHPYSKRKGIDWDAGVKRSVASGKVIGKASDCLIIPIRDVATFDVMAVQCINREGEKQTFGPLKFNGFICGNTLDKTTRWFVVEGWADAVSIVFHHYNGNAVGIAAFGAYAVQKALAEKIREKYNPDQIVILKDKEKTYG